MGLGGCRRGHADRRGHGTVVVAAGIVTVVCCGCGRGSLGGRGAALLAVVAAGAAVLKKFRWSKFRPKKQPNISIVL